MQILELVKRSGPGRPRGPGRQWSEEVRKNFCESRGFIYRPYRLKDTPRRPHVGRPKHRSSEAYIEKMTRDYRRNPPREVYKYAKWCKRCEEPRPKVFRNCPECGKQLRYKPHRPSCKSRMDVKRY